MIDEEKIVPGMTLASVVVTPSMNKMQSWLLTEAVSRRWDPEIFIMMMSSQIWDDGRALLPV